MSDFHQSGVITTFHRLGQYDLEAIEATLAEYTERRPMALVLPCLYSELEGPALKSILQHLRQVRYIRQVVVGLDRADRSEFAHARRFFSTLPQEVKILWRDGPRIRRLTKLMLKNDLSIGGPGKGSNMWLSSGFVLADERCKIVALHDCDILTYDRELLARLVFPLASPSMDYEFCKGFYARVSDRFYGRVPRCLATLLIRVL
jgi:glucosyl-3-phosphoglycerate synthase